MKKAKLWQKEYNLDAMVETFTVGEDRKLDMNLAPYDVIGSLAHIEMLHSINLLSAKELKVLEKGLKEIYNQIQSGSYKILAGVEDIHSQIELDLTRRLGDVGKKIHTGRSRNDQVLLDLKLYIRAQIVALNQLIEPLFNLLLSLSEKYKNVLMPGYTHLQVAMPSSFGLWFGAYAESLMDDMHLLLAAFNVANKNPLGSAAGYGSNFPLNRRLTTSLLGFDTLNFNTVYAQMGRGKTERLVSQAMAGVAETVGKMAMDIVLFLSQNFNFIAFPAQLTTGSSIMPHKKNPDLFEMVRARCNRIKALPNQIMLLMANLTSGYHRDFQLIKEELIPRIEECKSVLKIMHFALGKIEPQKNLLADPKYKHVFSVEAVNELVMQGHSFRDAYNTLSKRIEHGLFEKPEQINYTHEGSIGNLCNSEINEQIAHLNAQFNIEKIQKAEAALLS